MAPKRQPEAVVETPPRALEALARDVFALLVRDMGATKAKALWRSVAAKPGPHKNLEKAALQAKFAQVIEKTRNKHPDDHRKIIPMFADFLTEEKLGKRGIRNETAYSKALEANEKRLRRYWREHQAQNLRLLAALLMAPDQPKLSGLYDLGAAALAEKKDKNPP
jgi:hypothetical protein